MKRFIVLLILAVLTAGALVAETQVLIDFSQLTADLKLDNGTTQNEKTLVDYSGAAGATFTAEQKKLMKTSLAIKEWDVVLSSSSRTNANQSLTYTMPAVVKQDYPEIGGKTVMGIRVHFPPESINSNAVVQPPFEIPAYEDVDKLQGDGSLKVSDEELNLGRKFDNIGVVKNVGVLKSITVTVRGLNFPHHLSLLLKNADGEVLNVPIGYLNFEGWKTLTWENPNYITEVRNRTIKKYSLYPKSTPFVKLVGIQITRDASQEGGDFVTYVKDINITYDKAVMETEMEIDNENIWHILKLQQEARRQLELKRLGNLQVMRYMENQKMDRPETEATAGKK